MIGIISKKIGMTTRYNDEGYSTPCTLLRVDPCVVTQIKETNKDGYCAVQLGFDDKKDKHASKPLLGHFKNAKTSPKRELVEFRDFIQDFNKPVKLGDCISVQDIFEEGDYVDAIGISKGKGFQGVVKRHGFSGVGGRTHGQHNRERAPGAIGACSYPARVFKGMRMAGRMGNDRVKIMNLRVLKLLPNQNMMLVSGSVPGAKNGYVILEK